MVWVAIAVWSDSQCLLCNFQPKLKRSNFRAGSPVRRVWGGEGWANIHSKANKPVYTKQLCQGGVGEDFARFMRGGGGSKQIGEFVCLGRGDLFRGWLAVHRKGCSSVRTLPSTPSPSPNLFFLSAYNLFPLSLYTLKIMCTHFPYHNIFPAPSLAVFISLFSFSPLSFSMIHASTMTNSLSLSPSFAYSLSLSPSDSCELQCTHTLC